MTEIKRYIAKAAASIVGGARRAAYGTPENNFIRIARFWTGYLHNTGRYVNITPQDVSPMMRLMKEARLCESPDHLDSFLDIVGYALTGAEVNGVVAPASDDDRLDDTDLLAWDDMDAYGLNPGGARAADEFNAPDADMDDSEILAVAAATPVSED